MGGFHCQRAVHIDVKAVMSLDQFFILDMPYQIKQFLGTSHCKGRNHHVAAPVQGLLDDAGQVLHMVYSLFMVAVAIGGFHHHIIRLINILRIPYEGLVLIADVPGKYNLLGPASLGSPYLYGCGSQQMPHIRKTQGQVVIQFEFLAISHPFKMLQHILCILHGVKGLHLTASGAPGLTVLPLSLHLLYMGTVLQHDVAQVNGRIGGYHLAPEPSCIDPWQHARMIDMGMGQEHVVYFTVTYGKFRVLIDIVTLFHAAVDQYLCFPYFQKMTASSHLMIRPDKC